jgi:uncharacterized protein
MPTKVLLDTGALVCLLDRGQTAHEAVVDFFKNWRGLVVTTEAVITEASRLLGRVPGGRVACLDFVLRGGAVMVPSSATSLERARELILRYADLPMDYADATLVVLAEDMGVDLVLTTDRRYFEVYRVHGRKPFRILPE